MGDGRGLRASNIVNARFVGGWQEVTGGAVPANPAVEFSRAGTPSIAITKAEDFSFKIFLPGWEQPRAVQSYDAAVDLVTFAMRDVDGSTAGWNLHMEGFSRTEARNFLRTTEVQFTAQQKLNVAGFSRPRGVSSQRMLRTLSEHYDFQRAQIVETVRETVSDGGFHGTEAVRITAQIPAFTASKPTLFMRIRLFFQTRVTEPVRQLIEAAANKMFRGVVAKPRATPQDGESMLQAILADFKRDLKNLKIPGADYADFEIEVNADFGDFYVADAGLERNGRDG
jgi:hypothetical protein